MNIIKIMQNIKQGLEIKPVRWIDEVFEIALQRLPEPLPIESVDDKSVASDSVETEEDPDVLRRH